MFTAISTATASPFCTSASLARGPETRQDEDNRPSPLGSGGCARFEAHHALGTRARLAYEPSPAGRAVPLRRGKNGPAAYPKRDHVDGPAEDRRPVQCRDHAAAAGGDRRHAGKQSSDVPSHSPRQALHGGSAITTYLAEQNATDHQLMAWLGWTSISQAQVDTKAANRKLMARGAAKLFSGTGIGSPSDPVS